MDEIIKFFLILGVALSLPQVVDFLFDLFGSLIGTKKETGPINSYQKEN